MAKDRLDLRDQSAAQFAWEKGEPAGRGSDTLPTARWFFLPLVAGERRLGVLGIAHADDRRLLRTALLNSVSHDLRTPLVTIIGAAGHLADSELSAEARRDLAENIREEGERLDRYVQNLLDMTRLGHGALKPRLAPQDVAEIVVGARSRMKGVLRA